MADAFRKRLLRDAVEGPFYDAARLFGGRGEAGLERVFIEGARADARAGGRRAAWRKGAGRREEGRKEKIRGIALELKGSEGRVFSEAGEGMPERGKGARGYVGKKPEGAEGAGDGVSRKTLETRRNALKGSVKKPRA
jgi:hypothetical protein